MEVIYILLVCSLLVAALFLLLFRMAVKTGQYEDTDTPAHRILFDDKVVKNKEEK